MKGLYGGEIYGAVQRFSRYCGVAYSKCVALSDLFIYLTNRVESLSRGLVSYTYTHCGPTFVIVSVGTTITEIAPWSRTQEAQIVNKIVNTISYDYLYTELLAFRFIETNVSVNSALRHCRMTIAEITRMVSSAKVVFHWAVFEHLCAGFACETKPTKDFIVAIGSSGRNRLRYAGTWPRLLAMPAESGDEFPP